jgi:hypothetical protein
MKFVIPNLHSQSPSPFLFVSWQYWMCTSTFCKQDMNTYIDTYCTSSVSVHALHTVVMHICVSNTSNATIQGAPWSMYVCTGLSEDFLFLEHDWTCGHMPLQWPHTNSGHSRVDVHVYTCQPWPLSILWNNEWTGDHSSHTHVHDQNVTAPFGDNSKYEFLRKCIYIWTWMYTCTLCWQEWY